MKQRDLWRGLYILLAIPYFKPGILGVLAGTELLETAFDLWRLAAAGVIGLLYLYRMVKYRRLPSAVLLWLGAYLGFVAISTLLNEDNLWSLINHTMTIGTFCMLIELSVRENPFYALDLLVLPTSVLILVNLLLYCRYPGGLCTGGSYNYEYYFLGIRNLMSPILVPHMFLSCLRSSMYHGRINWFAYLMVGASTLTLLMAWTATGMMGMAVALVFLLFFYERRWQTLFNFSTTLAGGMSMFFGIVIFRLQNLFAFLIEDILHKGLSFTGRTDIWDRAIVMFWQSPILGYGIAQSGKVYRLNKAKYYHAHNVFLELLMEGGILALISFVMMLERAGRQLLIYRRHPYACLISAGLLSVAIMTSMEPFLDNNGLLIYALVFLGYYVGTLIAGAPTSPAKSH